MDRRQFIRMGMTGVGAGIVAPQLVLASASASQATPAGGIYFTKDAPGRWSKKISGHLPHIEIQKVDTNAVIEVTTGHEMKGFEHYIVKHVLLDKDFQFLKEHMFNPNKDLQAISKFTLNNYNGPIHVLSVCNKHDTWLNLAEI